MVTKSSLVTLFLALCLVLISADTLDFSERTLYPIPPAIELSPEPAVEVAAEPLVEPSTEPPIEPSYDPPPLPEPLIVAKRAEDGDRPKIPKEKETLRNTPARTKLRIDFLKSLKKAGPKFSEPIHKVISASLACQTGWKYSPSGISRITENKLVDPEKSFTSSIAPLNPEPGGERGLTKFELLRSKTLKAELFMFFRLSFSPKGEFAIEMNLDPTAEKGFGVSFPADTVRLPSGPTPSVSQTTGSALF
jgi:hypothetical protein